MPIEFSLRPSSRVLTLVASLGLVTNLNAQKTNVSVGPEPDWVRLSEWNALPRGSTNRTSENSCYLLFERQEFPQRKESFTRVVKLLENQTGVQDSGSLTFSFDPSFQELILHRVRINRDGAVLNRLERSKIKVIQPEPELGNDVFTGEHTSLLFVEDLRPGDALEYAYTVRGANPILDGHFSTRFIVQSGVPVERERFRVIWASTNLLYLRQYLTNAPPNKAPCNEGTEYLWDFTKLEGIPYEDELPKGYEPYPYIEFSDFRDWSQVVEWARPLYEAGGSNLPPELRELIAQWQTKSNEEKARMALEFVQDELRYTGIELGPDSYRPTEPAETFRLRYGDCKAKARLLCEILKQMSFEACPVLVHTSTGEGLGQRLPSPFAFNHVIVKLWLDGAPVWVDPTRSQQGGLLRQHYLPRLGKGLLVQSKTTNLEDIPLSAAIPFERVVSTFRLKDYESPASLTVQTSYHGPEADRMRQYLARTDAKQITNDYLNFYARYYPGIQDPGSLEVNDRRVQNILEVTEHYRVADLWKQKNPNERWQGDFYPAGIEQMLTEPDTRVRRMPLRIRYPMRREQEVVVFMPDRGWAMPPSEQSVDCEAFKFHCGRKSSDSVVRFQYDCETKISSVSAEKVPAYLKKLEEMQNLCGDTLYRPDGLSGVLSDINWLVVVIACFGAAVTLAGALWFWWASRTAVSTELPPPIAGHPQGLGGWLVLVGFGLCAMVIWRPVLVLQNWGGFFSTAVWQSVATVGGEQYHPLYGPLLIYEILGNIFIFGLTALALCLYFAKRRVFPRVYITLMVMNAAFLLVDEIVGDRIPYVAQSSTSSTSRRDVSRATLQAIVWGSYMVKSKRVKTTFVR